MTEIYIPNTVKENFKRHFKRIILRTIRTNWELWIGDGFKFCVLFMQNNFFYVYVKNKNHAVHVGWCVGEHTMYQKCETNNPRNETARPPSQFLHSCICEGFIQYVYSHDRSAYFTLLRLLNDRGDIYCKLLTDTWMQKLRTRPHSFISGNICLEFSIQCRTYGQKCGRIFDTKRGSAETTNLFILVTDLSRL
jgi:hypothetical protein